MDDLRFYVLFNGISVISGRWADDNKKAVCNGTPFTAEKISPRAGLEHGTARSVGAVEISAVVKPVDCIMVCPSGLSHIQADKP